MRAHDVKQARIMLVLEKIVSTQRAKNANYV